MLDDGSIFAGAGQGDERHGARAAVNPGGGGGDDLAVPKNEDH